MTKRNILIVLWVTISASLALVVASSGMPTPIQSMEWEVLQSLQQDGVQAKDVHCMKWPSDTPGIFGCGVTIASAPDVVIYVQWFEDGSWRFTEDSRP